MARLRLINSPTERTTAATDALLALLALLAAVILAQIDTPHLWRMWLWRGNFLLLALAAALGAVVHGVILPRWVWLGLWGVIYLLLGQVVALFTVAAVLDVWGLAAAQTALPALVAIALIFFVVVMLRRAAYFVFVVYQLVAMMFALGGYGWLWLAGELPGAGWMVAGIAITMLAAGVQASGRGGFTLIWQFDHNGAYHLIQMLGLALLLIGLVNSEL